MEIVKNNNIYGSNYWANSSNKKFSEIIIDNFQLPKKWGQSNISFSEKYLKNILKPVNGYSEKFSIAPEIIKNNDKFFLRYYTHAEIWVEPMNGGTYALDKCWQTQFYPSDISYEPDPNCYDACYKFYTTWLIDEDIELDIFSVEDSPFVILNKKINFNKINKTEIIEPQWIHFYIKNIGNHISNYRGDEYSVIDIKTPICDILIKDKYLAERLISERKKDY
jgi:hypothetical protein